jgi:hypothetical protein
VRDAERCAADDPRIPFSSQPIIDFRSVNLKLSRSSNKYNPAYPFQRLRLLRGNPDLSADGGALRFERSADQPVSQALALSSARTPLNDTLQHIALRAYPREDADADQHAQQQFGRFVWGVGSGDRAVYLPRFGRSVVAVIVAPERNTQPTWGYLALG